MQTKDLGPLVLDYCISFLDERDIGSKYHPSKDTYVLEASLMARIIKYNGDFRSAVQQSDTLFFSRLLKQMLSDGIVFSVTTRDKFGLKEDTRFNRFSVIIERKKHLPPLRGRYPKYLGERKHDTIRNTKTN